MAITPVRLQLSRARGFDLQALSWATNGLPAVVVRRPSTWGNAWSIEKAREVGFTGTERELAAMCAGMFRNAVLKGLPAAPALADIRQHLGGKNLACTCRLCDRHRVTGLPLGETCDDCMPCHADVLIELANGSDCERVP